jgi:hypothetical protein
VATIPTQMYGVGEGQRGAKGLCRREADRTPFCCCCCESHNAHVDPQARGPLSQRTEAWPTQPAITQAVNRRMAGGGVTLPFYCCCCSTQRANLLYYFVKRRASRSAIARLHCPRSRIGACIQKRRSPRAPPSNHFDLLTVHSLSTHKCTRTRASTLISVRRGRRL